MNDFIRIQITGRIVNKTYITRKNVSVDDFFVDEGEQSVVSSTIAEGEVVDHTPVPYIVEAMKINRIPLGTDASDLFLLDVKYNAQENLAQCIFYHERERSLYRWNDTSGHKPYFYTDHSMATIQTHRVAKSQEFDGMEEVVKKDLLEGRERIFTKIYGKTPLSIGGSNRAMRDLIQPAYEADIRYHINFMADRRITPATYYSVVDGKLKPTHLDMDVDIREELLEAFKGENKEQINMLEEYMPLLFQAMPDVFRCAFDIEVGSEKTSLPNFTNPIYPIISIALVDTDGRKICWVLNRAGMNQLTFFQNIEIRRFDGELTMLADFLSLVELYPLVLSFNGDNFDFPYLYYRSIKLGIDKKDIPISIRRNEAVLEGSIHVDLYQFFRQASIRLYAFGGKYDSASLDTLSRVLLGSAKLEHPDVWINDMDLETLVRYNVQDAELTLQLTQFDENITLNLIFILMRISKMPIRDFTRSAVSRWLHTWIFFEHRKRNYIIPKKEEILTKKGRTAASEAIIDGKKFQGAIVLNPKPGIWWNVLVLDFASLYPSIIKTKNLSYETINCTHNDCKKNRVPEVNHWICQKNQGMFSILLGFIRDTRVKWFKPRCGKSNLDIIDRRNNNIIQASLKVLINAGYGVFGSENFDFYCPPVAESTTAFARDAIVSTRDYIQKTLNIPVLYGDTDSVFVFQPNEEQVASIMKWGDEKIGIELGIDYEFRYVIFTTRKKNYFGITKDGYPIVKGLMAKKSNTPLIIREAFQSMLKHMTNVHTQDELDVVKEKIYNDLHELVVKLKDGNFTVNDVSTRVTLTKRIKDYDTWTPSLQCVAQLINAKIKKPEEFLVGERIDYVKINYSIPVRIPEGLAFKVGERKDASVIPAILVKDMADIGGNSIISIAESTFSQILSSLDISWDRIVGKTNVDDFF